MRQHTSADLAALSCRGRTQGSSSCRTVFAATFAFRRKAGPQALSQSIRTVFNFQQSQISRVAQRTKSIQGSTTFLEQTAGELTQASISGLCIVECNTYTSASLSPFVTQTTTWYFESVFTSTSAERPTQSSCDQRHFSRATGIRMRVPEALEKWCWSHDDCVGRSEEVEVNTLSKYQVVACVTNGLNDANVYVLHSTMQSPEMEAWVSSPAVCSRNVVEPWVLFVL
jgi:hypothetical protein